MIIITDRSGQLGNSLILYATFIAFGIENNVGVYNPSFFRYRNYFDFTGVNKRYSSKFIFRILYYVTRLLVKLNTKNARALDWHENINLDVPSELGYSNQAFYFVQGWKFRGDMILQKHKPRLINFFEPKAIYLKEINTFFDKNFNTGNGTIIGLHIRRGDYQNFESGKYFYTIDQYLEILTQLATLFGKSNPHFLICSNEKLHLSTFSKINARITLAPGHELLDLYCLSKCNYIAGPPSTYSMWASFYGDTPLYMIRDTKKGIEAGDFKIQSHF